MDLRQLESESSLQTWLLWAAEAFPRDPRFLMKLATHIYGLAVHGISERCVELPGERRRVAPTVADAHRLYLRRAAALQAREFHLSLPETFPTGSTCAQRSSPRRRCCRHPRASRRPRRIFPCGTGGRLQTRWQRRTAAMPEARRAVLVFDVRLNRAE